jgi:hypothetical protein
MSLDTFAKAISRVEVSPGFPRDLQPYMQQQAEILLADKKINAIPDWKAAGFHGTRPRRLVSAANCNDQLDPDRRCDGC